MQKQGLTRLARCVQHTGMNRLLTMAFIGGLLAAATLYIAEPARAEPLSQVVTTIQNSGGRYVRAGASLSGSDCSGLVSVAFSLATGQPIRRIGDTRSLIAGRWPGVLPGASENDAFVIGANYAHMTMRVNGVNMESSTSGAPYRVGPSAASPFEARFTTRVHVDPALLTLT